MKNAGSDKGALGPIRSESDDTILMTGASGQVGGYLRARLARPGRTLRLLDIKPLPRPTVPGEEFIQASVTDDGALAEAMKGVRAVIHLGGLSGEDVWTRILDINVLGTNAVFECARLAGVSRLVYASSNHAVGYHRYGSHMLPDGLSPRPDSFYGVSKAFGEALASLYHDRYGLDVVCIRIGSCFDLPTNQRMLETWLSPDDAGRLFEAALSSAAAGLHLVWGVSANKHRQWSLQAAEAIGYLPEDDASVIAPNLGHGSNHPASVYVGGDDMPQVPR